MTTMKAYLQSKETTSHILINVCVQPEG